VVRNRVEGNGLVGIIVINLNRFLPLNNNVEDNVLSGNTVDLGYGPTGTKEAGGNCFAGNTFATSIPADIEQTMPCGAASTLTAFAPFDSPPAPDGPDYRAIPAPPPQPTMPAGAFSATGGAGALQLTVDVGTIAVPNA
jgi:hypothetical protein